MKITRDDVKANKVMPHYIHHGVWVPPALLTNCLTNKEHYDSLKLSDRKSVYPDGWEKKEDVTLQSNFGIARDEQSQSNTDTDYVDYGDTK